MVEYLIVFHRSNRKKKKKERKNVLYLREVYVNASLTLTRSLTRYASSNDGIMNFPDNAENVSINPTLTTYLHVSCTADR